MLVVTAGSGFSPPLLVEVEADADDSIGRGTVLEEEEAVDVLAKAAFSETKRAFFEMRFTFRLPSGVSFNE